MKKNTIKAFTLVEMLIVIVIIGILIAALMPRMQAAQGRARDVSRKTALSQIQSAIVVSQGDKGEWPKQQSASAGIAVSEIKDELIAAGMNSIPMDPLKSKPTGLGSFSGNEAGDYGYIVTIRNGAQNGGFVLMAKTEVEGGSNWVVCSTGSNKDTLSGGKITSGTDLKTINLCQTVTKVTTTNTGCVSNTEKCFYNTDDELRYIVAY